MYAFWLLPKMISLVIAVDQVDQLGHVKVAIDDHDHHFDHDDDA